MAQHRYVYPTCNSEYYLDPSQYGGSKGVFRYQCGRGFTPCPPPSPEKAARLDAEKEARGHKRH